MHNEYVIERRVDGQYRAVKYLVEKTWFWQDDIKVSVSSSDWSICKGDASEWITADVLVCVPDHILSREKYDGAGIRIMPDW